MPYIITARVTKKNAPKVAQAENKEHLITLFRQAVESGKFHWFYVESDEFPFKGQGGLTPNTEAFD